jgi:hypothetical protein
MRNASLLSALGLLLAAGFGPGRNGPPHRHGAKPCACQRHRLRPLACRLRRRQPSTPSTSAAAATAPIISVAEGGAGGAWQAAFAAAEPDAVRGTIGGLLLSGASAQMSFLVDSASQGFFTFASMVVPSNDFFIGNDDPREYALFDANGALQINQITLRANEIWDAGSEVFDPRPLPSSATTACAPTRTRWWPSTLPNWPPSTAC